jgi:hypothetical protein
MKTVIVTVMGGVVQDVEVPEDVTVIVKDYDVEVEDDETKEDSDGKYTEGIWTH